jgi:hypothetical protein
MNTTDITLLVHKYRDTVRTLWNSHFLPRWECDLRRFEQEDWSFWDFRDSFEKICVELFAALVLTPVRCWNKISPASQGHSVSVALFTSMMPASISPSAHAWVIFSANCLT